MSRLNKIIAFFIVVVFAVTTYLFIAINNKKNLELGTKIVPEKQKRPERRTTDNFGHVIGKIQYVGQNEMEYLELMKGLVVIAKEERRVKNVKITKETRIEIPCAMLYATEEFSGEQADLEQAHNNEQTDTSSPASLEEKFCEADFEQLRDGDIVIIKEEKGEAKWIKKQ